MYRLSIDGEQAELSAGTKIKVSKKTFDLSDISNRGVRFTNSFTIPPTGVNIRLLGSPNVLASNNNAFEVPKTYVLSDQNTIVSSGNVIVRSFDEKKGIKIQLSEGVDFWNGVGALKLRDLTLDNFDFEFTTANMDAKKTLVGNDIFVTALHDAGDPAGTALVRYNKTRPFYRFKPILDQIAAEVGYVIDYSDVLDNTELNLTGCASNTDRFLFSDFKKRFEDVSLSSTLNLSLASNVFDVGNITVVSNVLTNTTYKTSYIFKGIVTTDIPSVITFVFNDRTESFSVPSGASKINFISDEADIGSTLQIRTNSDVFLQDVFLYSAVTESEIFDVESDFDRVFDLLVLADYNLPEMTCKDFFKIILKMWFLNVETDNVNKKITLTRFLDDLNTNNFTDLSGKINRNNSWESGTVYGKTNYLRYKNDENLDVDLGRAIFRVDNINAVDEKDFVLVNEFSASQEVLISTNRVVSYGIYSDTEVKRESVSSRVVFFDETGTFGINATFNDISFQRLFSQYYFSFAENTTRERVVSFSCLLDFKDFNDIQRRPLIFNEDQQGLFLVTDIEGYTNEGLTILKCVKYG